MLFEGNRRNAYMSRKKRVGTMLVGDELLLTLVEKVESGYIAQKLTSPLRSLTGQQKEIYMKKLLEIVKDSQTEKEMLEKASHLTETLKL